MNRWYHPDLMPGILHFRLLVTPDIFEMQATGQKEGENQEISGDIVREFTFDNFLEKSGYLIV
jgi:hypothetical protein